MNHPLKARLLVHMDQNPNDLSDGNLSEYIWEVEQLLQELRQRQVQRRIQYGLENPVTP